MSQQQTELIQKAEEIALLLVMLGESDGQGLAMVANLCEDLCQKAEAIKELQRMTTSWKWIKSQGISEPSSKTIQLLNKFASAANALLAGSTSVEFPFDDTSSKTSSSASTVESPFAEKDESLLAEFVETHSLLLEEFDSSLLEAMVFDPSATQELVDATTAAKRYLHNLKGDAGSLGLGDIERVCHFLEDCLMGTMINAFGGELFAFKEWCTERLADIVERRPFSITGAAFIERIEKSRSRSSSSTQSTTSQPAPSAVARPAMGKSATPELPPQYTMSGDKEIFTEFAAEAEEHLASVETTILESEGTFQKEEVDTIFRAVHSVKGGSAYFTLTEMTRTSHTLENILSEARDGQ